MTRPANTTNSRAHSHPQAREHNTHTETALSTTAVKSSGSEEQTNRSTLLRAEELAERWQVKTSQVYRLSREGVLPTVRIGRYFRYALSAVEAFESAGGVGSDG